MLVDEAFIEAGDAAESVAPILPPRTVVLRSFGKIYGLAGIRLGFAVAAADVAARLRAELGPWAVSGPAIALGIAALDDGDIAIAERGKVRDLVHLVSLPPPAQRKFFVGRREDGDAAGFHAAGKKLH